MNMVDILKNAVEKGASDIHIATDTKPMARITGDIVALDFPELTSEDIDKAIKEIIPESMNEKFDQGDEIDCGFSIKDVARFRVNIYQEKKGWAIAFRAISDKIPSVEDIGIQESIINLTKIPKGLILVTGPTGSGKSTLIACLIDLINRERKSHIITMEDPIEYLFEDRSCIVSQREIGNHSGSFANALKYALRQDPDIVLVGEMRDLETISMALTMAETGHLVFATLHTTDAAQTVDRIIDVFPAFQQQQVRMQLSGSLRAVISQELLPNIEGTGRVAAREVMIVNSAIANLIREGQTHQIYSAIQTGKGVGMQSMDNALADLCRDGLITYEAAEAKSNNPDALKAYL
ncbi:MAG: type IV pilus twitching motility protein PilT [Candidatus Omnitrophica bacterium]|nr:type IV pilus twitching motility protein PilT [Candidatus Omnitrophota bacterium]